MIFDSLGVLMSTHNTDTYYYPVIGFTEGLTTDYVAKALWKYAESSTYGTYQPYAKKSSDGKTVYWYARDSYSSSNERVLLNTSGVVYRYFAIG